MKKYGKESLGCFVDSAVLRTSEELVHHLLTFLPEKEEVNFNLNLDEFYSEQIDDLTDKLNDLAEEGYHFEWEAGDLILFED